VNLQKMIEEMEAEHQLLGNAIILMKRLAQGRGRRRGRPPAWMSELKLKRRGRPPGSKNKPKETAMMQ
jgi:hypothetical protein